MAGWHHWLDEHESEWTPGVGDGQGGLVCCDSWGRKESDTTEWLNWTELNLNRNVQGLLQRSRKVNEQPRFVRSGVKWGPSIWNHKEAKMSLSRSGSYTFCFRILCCSVAKSSLTLWHPGLQRARLPYLSLSPRVCSNSCPLLVMLYYHLILSPPSPLVLNLSQHQGLFQ